MRHAKNNANNQTEPSPHTPQHTPLLLHLSRHVAPPANAHLPLAAGPWWLFLPSLT
jgi:hypothetical protein